MSHMSPFKRSNSFNKSRFSGFGNKVGNRFNQFKSSLSPRLQRFRQQASQNPHYRRAMSNVQQLGQQVRSSPYAARAKHQWQQFRNSPSFRQSLKNAYRA